MPQIGPLRPYRYNPRVIGDEGAVIAPPYDVISSEKRRALLERDRYNIIQLILPEGEGDSKYAHAGELLRTWIYEHVLVRESEPALYPYAQRFVHPLTGEMVERRGILTAMQLSPFAAGEVLPHERTLSGPKADRLKLMHATEANLESIFGIYRDPGEASSARLEAICAATVPLVDVVDSDGVGHRLWRVADPAVVAAFAAEVAAERVYIVDGHHRYETALTYREERRASLGAHDAAAPGTYPFDAIMILLVPASDPGLVILPTHRVIHSLPAFDFDRLLERMAEHFTIAHHLAADDGLAALQAANDRPGFLLLAGRRAALATLRDDADFDDVVGADLPDVVRRLDVTILHAYLLERLLGISPQAQVDQRNIGYVKSAGEALAAAADPATQLVVMMNPTRLEQVEAVAESGHVMPQKSTYFYPKLASGLLINPLWEET